MNFKLRSLAIVATITLATAFNTNGQQARFDSLFTGERLRIDLILAGNSTSQYAYLDELHLEKEWSGPRDNTIDPFGYGDYRMEAYCGGELVFSTGFNTLFEEWRTTEQAKKIDMAANQSLWMPFPRKSVHIVVSSRIRATGSYSKLIEFDVDPSDRHIIREKENDYPVSGMMVNGPSSEKADVAILAEGYTSEQMGKFRDDAKRMMDYILSMEPYASRRNDFNFWIVESPSKESGTDIPQNGIWKSTVMESTFDTFYEDRYLTVMNHKKIASAASGAPFDAIIVLCNETKYGGGGIYNSYAMGTSDHKLSCEVFIHEFGHSFAGLGDEYYDSSTAYVDFYPLDIEPWEPNITTKVNFDAKWKDMMGVKGAAGTVGLYEGAGYVAKGCFRPVPECRMLNNTAPEFCPVCRRAISRMIDFYCNR